MLSGRTRLDVGNSGVDYVGVDLRYGLSVSGQFEADGQAPGQFRMDNLRVQLTPTESLPFGNADAQVDEKGQFTLTVSANGHTARAAVFVREPLR